MSFQDLEYGSQKNSCASKMQPKQWHHEESSYEHRIKVNIQKMQESARLASEQLERAQRTRMSKRMNENLNQALERSQELARETEQDFRDWTIHLAGEPRVRHVRKFAYEKLEKAFKEEVASLKDARRRAVAIHKKAADAELLCSGPGSPAHESFHGHTPAPSEEERCLLAALENVRLSSIDENDSTILALKRAEIMKQIQGQHFVSIDAHVEKHSSNVKFVGREVKENNERRRSQFERLCCALTISMIVMYFMLMHHLHPRSISLMKLGGFNLEPASMAPSAHQPLILHSWSMG